MEKLHKIPNWIGHNKLAWIIALVFAVLITIITLPPQEQTFFAQRRLLAVSVHAMGIISPFALALGRFAPFAAPLVLGLLIGLLIQKIWRQCRIARVLLVVALAANALFVGDFITSWAPLEVGPPYASQDYPISDTSAVRVVAYPEQGFIPGAHFFFLVTHDGGASWQQFMYFRHDDPVAIDDWVNVGSFSDTFFWVWTGWELAVTHDGGTAWTYWSPRDTWSNWVCCNYSLVENVAFQTEQGGTMIVNALHDPETSLLYTTDGGASWHVAVGG